MLLHLRALLEPGGVGGDRRTRRGRASRARGRPMAITTWTSAMPPFVAHAFWPLITHSSVASSYLARGADRRDVGAGVGLRRAEGGDLRVVGGAEACGIHSPICSRRALAEDRRNRERGAHDRHADAGVAPEQLLVDERQRQARLGRARTGRGPRSRRGRSSPPPGSPATASPRARPIRRRPGGRRRPRSHGPSHGCPSDPASARARRSGSSRRSRRPPPRRPPRRWLRSSLALLGSFGPQKSTSADVTSQGVGVIR